MMRGIDTRHEIDPTQLLRDTRTMGQRIADFFGDATNIAITLITMAGVSYYFSPVTLIMLSLGIFFFFYAYTRKKNPTV